MTDVASAAYPIKATNPSDATVATDAPVELNEVVRV